MSGKSKLGRLLGIILGGACSCGASSATAQITPDRTLPNNSNVTINGSVFNITGGTQAGRNLFHSFQQFSVPTGGTASFNNGLDIQNIFSRVTGGEVSNIDGLIKASGTANLFFINPNGIVFGKNASLNVGGSFVASTANSLKFADGFEYSAIAPKTSPLLTISVPSGLQFGTNPGSIQVQGDSQGIRTTSNLMDTTTGLQVQPNQTLALVGGDINLEGATLKTAGGRIELGSVAGNGLVSLTQINKGFSFGYGGVQNEGNIQLSRQAAVDASGEGGGDIQVWGRNVTLTDGSEIEAITLGSNPGGSLVVNAQDSLQLTGTANFPSGLFADVNEGATGAGGNLTINTHQLSVQDGAQVSASTSGTGNSGNLVVAADSIQLTGTSTDGASSGLFAQAHSDSKGNGGNLIINTHQLFVQGRAQVSASTNSAGKGGDVTINDTGELLVQGGAQVDASTFGAGNSGSLTVTANSIQLTGTSTDGLFSSGLFAQANSDSKGNGGNLIINTHQLFLQDGAQISASTNGAGKGGDVTINNTGQLLVQGGAQVSDSTFGAGNSGNLVVTADSIQLTGTSTDGAPSGLFASTTSGSKGAAGNLTINTHQLSVQDGARVSASTSGTGKGGNLVVTADSIQLTGTSTDDQFSSGLFTEANSDSKGNGGNLTIDTHQLSVQGRAQVSASTFGAGKGGDLTINDTGQLLVQGGAEVSASTFGTGNSGSLTVTANSIQLTGTSTDGALSGLFTQANSGSKEAAGNLTINTHQLSVQGRAQVSASTFGAGKGGDLTINDTGQLLVQGGAEVSASTFGTGNSGSLTVTANSIQLTGTSTDGALSGLLAVSSGSTGNAGNLTINTHQLSVQDGAQVSASTFGAGKGGDLTINDTGQLLVQGGAQVSASTFGTGNSGSLTVTANSIQLMGTSTDGASSGLFAQANSGSKGDAGNLTIHTQDLTVQNGATVSVNSPQGQAGDLTITAKNIRLDLGSLTATTAVTSPDQSGANITLQGLDLLFLRNNSFISAQATSNTANGGNITIDALNGFVVAAPSGSNGSDIVASAFRGRGGNIQITTQSIYGLTSGRSIVGNGTNDIDASSQFNQAGTVNLNILYIDPSQELVPLSTNLINTNALIANSCIARTKKQQGTFNITGTGGLPNRPGDAFISSYPTGTVRNVQGNSISSSWHKGDPIVEPQGVYQLPNGHLVLSRECS